MRNHAQRLQRLLAIRRIGEEAERRHLQAVLASAAEAESAASRQQETIGAAAADAARALRDGNREEWLYAEARAEVAGWNRELLRPILQARRAEVEPATSAFLERRRDREQAEDLIRKRCLEQQVREERKAQAQLDEWFLGQLNRKRS